MNRAFVVICFCSLLASFPLPGESGLFGEILSNVASTAKWILKTAKPVLQIGHDIISSPLQVAEITVKKVDDLVSLGLSIPRKIVKDALGIVREIKAIDILGENSTLFLLPKGVIYFVDTVKSEAVNMTLKGLKIADDAAKATLAYMIYTSLKVVFGVIDKALVLYGDCVTMPPIQTKIKTFLVSYEIISTKGLVCGVSHLTPVYNVTITRKDARLLVINIPLKVPHLHVDIDSLNVPSVLDGKNPVNITIKEVNIAAQVTFQRGTILKFVRLHIGVTSLQDFEAKFFDTQHSFITGVIESLSPMIGDRVKDSINERLKNLGQWVYDSIPGKQPTQSSATPAIKPRIKRKKRNVSLHVRK